MGRHCNCVVSMWENSAPARLFRRKHGGDSPLPRFVENSASDDKKRKFKLGKYGSMAVLLSTIIIMFFLLGGFGLFSDESPFVTTVMQDDEDDDESSVLSMEDIVKRHPFAYREASASPLERFASSSLLTNGPPRKVSASPLLPTPPSKELAPSPLGHIVFFSFHGRVGTSIIMKSLSEQLGYVDGGDLLLQQKVQHNRSLPDDRWNEYDENSFTNANKETIRDIIKSEFATPAAGLTTSTQRKMVSVHMTDAWANKVDISWLLEALHREGGVSHVISIVRNPIRAKLSGGGGACMYICISIYVYVWYDETITKTTIPLTLPHTPSRPLHTHRHIRESLRTNHGQGHDL